MDLTPDQIFAIKTVEDASKAAIEKIRKEWHWRNIDEMEIFFHFKSTEVKFDDHNFCGQNGQRYPIEVSYPDMIALFRKQKNETAI